jgi:4-hydroxy-4-methyl-2-oxoglutarate aldolase
MIEETPLLDISRRRAAPDAGLLERLRGVPTSFVVDAMGGRGALDWRIKPLPGGPQAVIGYALTCANGPSDNLALCAAVALCRAGDVLVAGTDGYTGAAVAGDLILGIAKNRGAVGFVTDGLVRDTSDIEALALPCFAMGVTPNSPGRNGPGSVGLPIVCGCMSVATDDIIIADRDGVVIVPRAVADAVIEKLKGVRAAEAQFLAAVQAGKTTVDFVEPVLAGPRVRYIA